jgi:hypothetical protein
MSIMKLATARIASLLLAAAIACPIAGAQENPPPQTERRANTNNGGRERSFPAIESGKWKGSRLRDGQPDVQGHWSNTISNHSNFTDPQGRLPGEGGRQNRPQAARNEGARNERAPSRVSDPADGQVPFQPWAREKQREFLRNFSDPTKPEYVEPFARCFPGGIPKSFMWHGFEIRQYPGYVLFLFDSGTRIVHLESEQHLPSNIKLWNADSRGHWEGNTLVVDVANNNSKARFGRSGEFASENVHVVERYVFKEDGSRFNYVATFTDPTVYTRPFTVTIPVRRYTEKDTPDDWNFQTEFANQPTGRSPLVEHIERICVENNGGFGGVAVPATTGR